MSLQPLDGQNTGGPPSVMKCFLMLSHAWHLKLLIYGEHINETS